MRISIPPIMKDIQKPFYSYLNVTFILIKKIKSLEWFDHIKFLIYLTKELDSHFLFIIDNMLQYIGIYFDVRIFNNMPR